MDECIHWSSLICSVCEPAFVRPLSRDEMPKASAPTQQPPARRRITYREADNLYQLHGMDRTLEGMRLFGRNWSDVAIYYKEVDRDDVVDVQLHSSPIPRNLIDLVGAP